MLPDAVDPADLRTAALLGIAVVAVVAVLVARMVRRMVLRVVLLGVLAGLGLYLWSERAALEDCRATCACSFAGLDVQVPGCPEG